MNELVVLLGYKYWAMRGYSRIILDTNPNDNQDWDSVIWQFKFDYDFFSERS